MEADCLLFDLDGTLTNPARGITECIRYALDRMGEAPAQVGLERYIGPPLTETFQELLADPDENRVTAAIGHYRERFADTGLFENEVYAGIPEVLTKFCDTGYELRVATAKPHVYANRIVDHFELRRFFPVVYGPELSGQRNDKGELIRYLLGEESISPTRTWMIGDRKHDIVAARQNGLRSVGVVWGFGSREELELAGADRMAESVPDLPSLIER